jgi:hypothetical protein
MFNVQVIYSNYDACTYVMERIVMAVSIYVSVLVQDGHIWMKHVAVLPTLTV